LYNVVITQASRDLYIFCYAVEHACHVTLSASKLLSRIVTPEEITAKKSGEGRKDVASDLHDFSYGINSDPLTQFSLIMAALIHGKAIVGFCLA